VPRAGALKAGGYPLELRLRQLGIHWDRQDLGGSFLGVRQVTHAVTKSRGSRLEVDRDRKMNAGAYLALVQNLLQVIAIFGADDVDVPDMRAVTADRRWLEPGPGKQSSVRLGVRAPLSVPLLQVAQLDAQDCRLDLVHARVEANLLVVIALVGTVIAQQSETAHEVRI